LRLIVDGRPPVPRNLRRERRRWDDIGSEPLAMGCAQCLDLGTCGGQHRAQRGFSCLDDCCGNPTACDSVCPRNPLEFRLRVREVDGFNLSNIPSSSPRPAADLPDYVPLLYHGNRRRAPLACGTVAIPLFKMYGRTGLPRYASLGDLYEDFHIASGTNIILVGSGQDKNIEKWWGLSQNRRALIDHFAGLGITLVTSPNFSLFTDVPRYDDLYNIKRIGVAWQEFVAGGVSCALHINARTDRDYDRFAEMIAQRDEITEIVFEFGTGGGWPGRRQFHARHLAELAKATSRPLRLIMVGGSAVLNILAPAFQKLTYIDTVGFMATIHRQQLVGEKRRIFRVPAPTDLGEPVDELLVANVEFLQRRLSQQLSEWRQQPKSNNVRQRKIPEREPSEIVAPVSDPVERPRSSVHGRPTETASRH
jgi:hypothetical protein